MNYSTFRFTLNMHTHRSQASVSAFYGDTAVRLLISLTDGGVPYLIGDGCTAVLSGTKADGTKLNNRCVIVNGATIQYDFTPQTSNCVGVINCEITLYDAEGKVVTAPKFTIVIDEREVNGNDIPASETEMDVLDDIVVTETARVNAEASRVEAEKARVDAETARDQADTARNTAEQARVEAEEKRATEFASFKEDWDDYNIEVTETAVKEIVGKEIEGKVDKIIDPEARVGTITVTEKDGTQKAYKVDNQSVKETIVLRDAASNFYVGTPSLPSHATPKWYVDDVDKALDNKIADNTKSIKTLADIVKTIDSDPFMIPVKESEKAYSRIAPTTDSKLGSDSPIALLHNIVGDTVKPRKNIFEPTSIYNGLYCLTVSDGGIIHASRSYNTDEAEYEIFYYTITLPPGTWYVNTHFTSKNSAGVSVFFEGDSINYGATSVTTSVPLECKVVIEVNKDIVDGDAYIEYGYTDESGEFIPTGDDWLFICDRYFYVSVSEYPNGVFGEEDNVEGLVHIPVTKVESYNSIVFNPEKLEQGRYIYNGNRELKFKEDSTTRSITAYLTEGTYTVACYVYNSATDSYSTQSMCVDALVRGLKMDSEFYNYSYSNSYDGTYEILRKSFGLKGYTFDVPEACNVKLTFWGADDFENVYIVINRGSEPIPITDHKSNSHEMPDEILTRCPDYGKKYTYIDFDKKEFVNEGYDFVLQNVKASDFARNYSTANKSNGIAFAVSDEFIDFVSTDAIMFGTTNNCIYGNTAKYAYWVGILTILGFLGESNASNEEWNTAITQFVEYVNKRAEDGNPITFRFKYKNNADIIRTDISDILTDYEDFKEIEVYEGGTVTLANTPRLPVESTMSFMQPELEV